MKYQIDNEMFQNAINKWEATAPIEILLDLNSLKKHMLSEHGIKFNSWPTFAHPEVVDEKKYMMFVLRFA